MKLSDIFNLPKNAQGNKLFKKITNKYGLSKEEYEALKNVKVDNNNEKLEYYYCDEGFTIELITVINNSVMPIKNILLDLSGKDIDNTLGIVKTNLIHNDINIRNNKIVGFCVIDEKSFRTFSTDRGFNYCYSVGSLYDRIFNPDYPDEGFTDEVLIDLIEPLRYLAENFKVSKEQYESLITIK